MVVRRVLLVAAAGAAVAAFAAPRAAAQAAAGAAQVPVPAPAAPPAVAPAAPPAAPLAAAPAPDAAVARGRLRGQVRGPGLKPVPGATAAAVRAEAPPVLAVTATDAQGFLSMDGVPQGTWKLTIFAPGYLPGNVEALAVGGPFRAVADLTLRPGTEKVAPALALPAPAGPDPKGLRVLAVTGSEPLSGVRLRLEPLGHRADPLVADTSASGEILLPDLAPGHWRVSLGRAGWTRLVVPDVEVKGGPVTILARLLPLPEGTPVPVEELLPPPRLLD